jgi:integrase
VRKKLSATFIENVKPGSKRIEYHDTACPGLALMVTPTGHKSFTVRGRIHEGDGRSVKLATLPIGLDLKQARREARRALELAAAGQDPREVKKAEKLARAESKANTFAAVVKKFIAVEGRRGLRTFDQVAWSLNKYVLPRLGARPITQIRKSDATRLFHEVAEAHGLRSAERAVQHLKAVLDWHAKQVDDYVSAIPRGHIKAASRARDRVLSDREIAAFWAATETDPGRHDPFRPLARLLLLSGRRRNEVAGMVWSEIGPEGFLLPSARNKTKRPLLSPLALMARAIIEAQPRIGAVVFSRDGRRPISDWDQAKAALDGRMLAALRTRDPEATLEPWVLHDLRRTARTLMSRLRVRVEVAEHALGHVIPGVRGRYDLHQFLDEKIQAYAALANEVMRIVGAAPAIPKTAIEPSIDPVPAGEIVTSWGIARP